MTNNQTRNILRYVYGGIFFLIFTIFLFNLNTPIAYGRSFRMRIVPESGRAFGCAICHVNPRGGGKLNPFGKDYAKIGIAAGEKYTTTLGETDSDNDGFTNDQEFAEKTHPGDPASKPEKAKEKP